jgi:glyoxalase superfamily protein
MSDVIKLSGVGVDCPNAGELAAFYADITGGTVTGQSEQWASMSGPGGSIDFWTVPDHRPPTWPTGATPKQLHLDFYFDDLEATEVRVLAAGATKFDDQPNADHCYVYADPAGHPFCLSTWGNPDA